MSRYAGMLLGLGLALAAVAGSRVWVRATVRDPVLGVRTQDVTGPMAAPALAACALVALAAMLVVLLTRRRARASGLLVLAGSAVWAGWLVVQVLRDPVASAQAALTDPAVSVASAQVIRGGATAWPWACAAGIVLVLAAIVWVVGAWAAASRTPAPRGSPALPSRDSGGAVPLSEAERARRANHDAWRDLSDGKDPTD